MTPRKFTWGVKRGILTPDVLERNIFWYTGQLILSKIIKTVATSCQILRLKCTKFDFGWGSATDPIAGFKGPPRNVVLIILTPSQKLDPVHLSQTNQDSTKNTIICS